MSTATQGKKKKIKKVKEGDCILLQRGLVGVVKYAGPLDDNKNKYYLGVQLGEGQGECNGMFRGIRYFDCPMNKGMFIEPKDVKKVISSEDLLLKVVALNKKVKKTQAEVSRLSDELNLSKEKAKKTMASMTASTTGTVAVERTAEQFLKQEMGKKWYLSCDDLVTRYPNDNKQQLETMYNSHKKEIEGFPETPAHSRIVYTVCSSPKDNLVASGSDDKTIRLWRKTGTPQAPKMRCITYIQLRSCINSLAFSPDGSTLAAALDSGWIELYDLHNGKMTGALEGQTTSEVWTICFSPDGANLISGALDRAVRIWDVKERECMWALRGHDEWVNGVAVSSDGRSIVSGSGDKTVRVWDTKNMACRSTLRGHTDFVRSVCVTEESTHIVSASDDCQLRVWDLEKAVCTNVLTGHSKGIYSVSAGKGNTVASASRDATVKLWDITNPKSLQEFKGHRGDVNSCVFVDNGEFVCSGSDDKQVHIFGVKTGL